VQRAIPTQQCPWCSWKPFEQHKKYKGALRQNLIGSEHRHEEIFFKYLAILDSLRYPTNSIRIDGTLNYLFEPFTTTIQSFEGISEAVILWDRDRAVSLV
jgi:hypothetical protein